jgi:hypothetical protein
VLQQPSGRISELKSLLAQGPATQSCSHNAVAKTQNKTTTIQKQNTGKPATHQTTSQKTPPPKKKNQNVYMDEKNVTNLVFFGCFSEKSLIYFRFSFFSLQNVCSDGFLKGK